MVKKSGMIVWDWVAIALLIVGGLTWGTQYFFGFNIVQWIGRFWSMAVPVLYAAVSLSAVYSIVRFFKLG